MRKVVDNSTLARDAFAKDARYAGGGRVARLQPPVDVGEAFAKLEGALRAMPQVNMAPVMAALDASRDAVLAAVAGANRPRKFTMEHVRDAQGRIVKTTVSEE